MCIYCGRFLTHLDTNRYVDQDGNLDCAVGRGWHSPDIRVHFDVAVLP